MPKILKFTTYETQKGVPVQRRAGTEVAPVEPLPETVEAEQPQPPASSPEADSPQIDVDVLLAEAQSQVEAMLNEAQAQVNQWQAEARQSGYEAGYTEAKQTVEAELQTILSTAQALLQEASQSKNQFLGESRDNIGALATAIAQKIIEQELTLNPTAIATIVSQTIAAAQIQEACHIHLNPADHAVLVSHWETSSPPADHNWQLVADEAIQRGGCLIKVAGGTVDAQIETKLNQVTSALAEVEPIP